MQTIGKKHVSRCLKTLVWLFWPKTLACLGGFGQGLCTQLVFSSFWGDSHQLHHREQFGSNYPSASGRCGMWTRQEMFWRCYDIVLSNLSNWNHQSLAPCLVQEETRVWSDWIRDARSSLFCMATCCAWAMYLGWSFGLFEGFWRVVSQQQPSYCACTTTDTYHM